MRNHRPKRKLGWKPFADDLPDREQARPPAPPDARNLEPMFIRVVLVIAVIALAVFCIYGVPAFWTE